MFYFIFITFSHFVCIDTFGARLSESRSRRATSPVFTWSPDLTQHAAPQVLQHNQVMTSFLFLIIYYLLYGSFLFVCLICKTQFSVLKREFYWCFEWLRFCVGSLKYFLKGFQTSFSHFCYNCNMKWEAVSTWQALTWPSRQQVWQHNKDVHKLKVKLWQSQQKEFALNDNKQLFEVSLVKMVVYVLVEMSDDLRKWCFDVTMETG